MACLESVRQLAHRYYSSLNQCVAQAMIERNLKSQFRAGSLKPESEPLVTHIYTADPSAHVFNDKIYIYPSHDVETDRPVNEDSDHFDMCDYHVISMDIPYGKCTDHGNVLDVKDVQWAERQMWAPDAAEKDGKYYLYFPAKNYQGVFQIGVAIGDKPEGPFIPEPTPIQGAFSIDPAVFQDVDDRYYLYFGGIQGGQLQKWRGGEFGEEIYPKAHQPALMPKVVTLADNMLDLAEPVKDLVILDRKGDPLCQGDTNCRYFEAPWMHKHNGIYYFSYSTGDTHRIVYSTGMSPYGPFTYQGVILEPVLGWTTHHSIAKYQDTWYLFYHDSFLSGGQTHLRSIKMIELKHKPDGSIETIQPYQK